MLSPLFCRLPLWYLQGIRIIKLFAWEKDFMSKINKSRGNEMRSLRSYMVSEPGLVVPSFWPRLLSPYAAMYYPAHVMILVKHGHSIVRGFFRLTMHLATQQCTQRGVRNGLCASVTCSARTPPPPHREMPMKVMMAGVIVQWNSVTTLVGLCTFLVHTRLLGRTITASQGFTALSLFGILRFPLVVLPNVVNFALQVSRSALVQKL